MSGEHETDPARNTPATARDSPALFDWPQRMGVTETVLRAMEASLGRRRRRRRQIGGAAVALALTLLAGVAWQPWADSAPATAVATGPASVSVPLRQTLPDGSVVDLNEGAEIAVEFGPALRRVIVRQGEAHFDVVKDPARDFVVRARGVEVRAIGTEFVVAIGETAVEVLVTEGRVAVEAPPAVSGGETAGRPGSTEIGAGYRLTVEPGAAHRPALPVEVSAAEIGERLTWRIPKLQFSGTTLHEALPMINRHSLVRLTLANADLGTVRLSGMIRADNIEALLALLETDHGIKAERVSPSEFVLRPTR